MTWEGIHVRLGVRDVCWRPGLALTWLWFSGHFFPSVVFFDTGRCLRIAAVLQGSDRNLFFFPLWPSQRLLGTPFLGVLGPVSLVPALSPWSVRLGLPGRFIGQGLSFLVSCLGFRYCEGLRLPPLPPSVCYPFRGWARKAGCCLTLRGFFFCHCMLTVVFRGFGFLPSLPRGCLGCGLQVRWACSEGLISCHSKQVLFVVTKL